MPTVEGNFIAKRGIRFAIVAGRFNEFIVARLVEGAMDCFVRHGIPEKSIEIFRVPGSFEIPPIAKKVAESGRFDAVICLGAVIRGDTPHFEFVSAEVSKGIAAAAMETGVPIIYGILTTDNVEQAVERAGTKAGNRGFTAALDAIEMANLAAIIKSPRRKRAVAERLDKKGGAE